MKILFVVHQFYPKFISGTEQYVLSLAKTGIKKGLKIKIFTVDPDFNDTKRPKEIDDYFFEGIPVLSYRFDKQRERNPILCDYYHPEIKLPFKKALKDFKPDIVHFFHLRWLGVDRIFDAKEFGAKTVFNLMDFWSVCPIFLLLKKNNEICTGPGDRGWDCRHCLWYKEIENKYNDSKKEIDDILLKGKEPEDLYTPSDLTVALLKRKETIKKALEEVDLVISPSKIARNVIIANQIFPKRLEIIPYGIDYSNIENISETIEYPIKIGYIGTFAPHKGLHILIKGFNEINDKDSELHLFGRFGDFPEYDKLLKELSKNNPKIFFEGPFKREELQKVLSSIHILVVPSQWMENTPFVVLEARASGRYIIASDIPGITELEYTDKMFFFSREDHKELASKLNTLIEKIKDKNNTKLKMEHLSPSIEKNWGLFLKMYNNIIRSEKKSIKGVNLQKKVLLSVLMPVYNEKDTLEEIIKRVKASPVDKEIIIVDDGSTDGTREILNKLKKEDPELVIIFQEKNQGKGAAIRKAIEHARGEICIIQDADLEYDPQDYPELIKPILEGKTNVVYGSRPKMKENKYPLDIFRLGSLFLTLLTNILYFCWITDEPTCYKVFKTDLLKSIPLKCKGFEFCPEVTAKVRKRGEKIVEVPIHYYKRTVEEGKKIRWKDAIIGAWTLIKYRFKD